MLMLPVYMDSKLLLFGGQARCRRPRYSNSRRLRHPVGLGDGRGRVRVAIWVCTAEMLVNHVGFGSEQPGDVLVIEAGQAGVGAHGDEAAMRQSAKSALESVNRRTASASTSACSRTATASSASSRSSVVAIPIR